MNRPTSPEHIRLRYSTESVVDEMVKKKYGFIIGSLTLRSEHLGIFRKHIFGNENFLWDNVALPIRSTINPDYNELVAHTTEDSLVEITDFDVDIRDRPPNIKVINYDVLIAIGNTAYMNPVGGDVISATFTRNMSDLFDSTPFSLFDGTVVIDRTQYVAIPLK